MSSSTNKELTMYTMFTNIDEMHLITTQVDYSNIGKGFFTIKVYLSDRKLNEIAYTSNVVLHNDRNSNPLRVAEIVHTEHIKDSRYLLYCRDRLEPDTTMKVNFRKSTIASIPGDVRQDQYISTVNDRRFHPCGKEYNYRNLKSIFKDRYIVGDWANVANIGLYPEINKHQNELWALFLEGARRAGIKTLYITSGGIKSVDVMGFENKFNIDIWGISKYVDYGSGCGTNNANQVTHLQYYFNPNKVGKLWDVWTEESIKKPSVEQKEYMDNMYSSYTKSHIYANLENAIVHNHRVYENMLYGIPVYIVDLYNEYIGLAYKFFKEISDIIGYSSLLQQGTHTATFRKQNNIGIVTINCLKKMILTDKISTSDIDASAIFDYHARDKDMNDAIGEIVSRYEDDLVRIAKKASFEYWHRIMEKTLAG